MPYKDKIKRAEYWRNYVIANPHVKTRTKTDRKRENGEGWEIKNRIPFKISCCDCGLVHNLVIVAPNTRKGAVLGIAAERNERATGQKRRHLVTNKPETPEEAARRLGVSKKRLESIREIMSRPVLRSKRKHLNP